MKVLLLSVFDSKVGAYGPVVMARSKGEAVRQFTDWCRDPQLPFGKHPADYRLVLVGEFDDVSGFVMGRDPGPEPVVGADELGLT